MEAENDVMKKDVNQVHTEKPINVSHMEAENDVMKKDVKKEHTEKPINA